MHLLFLTPEYPHPKIGRSGGLGTSIRNLTEQLVKNGVRVSVVVSGQKESNVFTEGYIHFHLVRHKKYPVFGFYFYRKLLEGYVNTLVKNEKIDLIEAPDWTGITAFMKLRAPLVIRFHGSDAYFCKLENRPQKRKNFYFENIALQRADALVSVSEFTAMKTKEIFGFKKPVTVIPNSVDISVFSPAPEQEQENRVLYFGSLIRKKGVLELSKTFNLIQEKLPGTRFVFAGKYVKDVLTNQSTKALILNGMRAATQKCTLFLEEVPYEDIKEEIAKATVVVLPSFAEALPMSWLEAMAMEKALVTSDIGWAQEIMTDGITGYTVAPENHELYARRTVELLQNHELRKKFGKQARQLVKEKFSAEVVTAANINFYRSVIDSRKI